MLSATLTVKPIYVEQMIMTHGINADSEALDEVDVFKPDVGRIYSFARVPAKANEKLILKWYYQNELIGAVDNIVSDQGQIYWYLERPELFPQGQYRVELFDKTVHLKSKTFKVEK